MPPLTPARLEEILALAAKATPGEWTACLHVGIPDAHIRAEIHGCNLCDVIEGTESSLGRVTHEDMQANARHIAACNPPTVTAIITRLLAAEAERDALANAFEEVQHLRDLERSTLANAEAELIALRQLRDRLEEKIKEHPEFSPLPDRGLPQMTVADDLRAARALIDSPEKWRRLGAWNALLQAVGEERAFPAYGALERIIPRGHYRYWENDPATTHNDVLVLFDLAIAAEEQSNV